MRKKLIFMQFVATIRPLFLTLSQYMWSEWERRRKGERHGVSVVGTRSIFSSRVHRFSRFICVTCEWLFNGVNYINELNILSGASSSCCERETKIHCKCNCRVETLWRQLQYYIEWNCPFDGTTTIRTKNCETVKRFNSLYEHVIQLNYS